jgi:putative transposase
MTSIGRRYVRHINRTYLRTGALWDSRYKSSVVHADSYLLTCQRYLELDPVRAAMVYDPAHYRRSSYRQNALGQLDTRLTPHAVYAALATSDEAKQTAYRALFRTELDADAIDDIRLALNQNQPLRSKRFHT